VTRTPGAHPRRPRAITKNCSLVSRVLGPLRFGDRIDKHGILRVSQVT